MKEQFLNFSAWIANFVMAIDQWENDNGKTYKASDPDTELNLLAGMFQADMTPQEAADTFTTTKTRLLVDQQLNVFICAAFLQWGKQTSGEILGMIGRESEGKPALVKGPTISVPEFMKVTSNALSEIAKEIIKKRDKGGNM